jgi:hypothetical protein
MSFKRNQIEDAIAELLDEPRPSSELRTRIKRLLDTDRGLGRKPRSDDPEQANYAFYSSDAPGKGADIWFSGYEAFALFIGLQMLEQGWPQGFAVSVLRRARPDLEREHARILRQDPAVLFNDVLIEKILRTSDTYVDNADPVYLVIVPKTRKQGALSCSVCRGMKEISGFLKQLAAQSWTSFELVTPAHFLADKLSTVQPRLRGRSR